MKKFQISGIIWDCDGVDPQRYDLPNNAVIEAVDEDEAVEALSDKYGFCIESVTEINEI